MKSALTRVIEDAEADGGTPTPSTSSMSPTAANVTKLEIELYDLMTNEKWSAAISHVKNNRDTFTRDRDNTLDMNEDVALVLNIYCRRLIQERPGTKILLQYVYIYTYLNFLQIVQYTDFFFQIVL